MNFTILQTHNVRLVEPLASSIITMKDGQVYESRFYSPTAIEDLSETLHSNVDGEDLVNPSPKGQSKSNGKLVVPEEIQEGHISGNSSVFVLISCSPMPEF